MSSAGETYELNTGRGTLAYTVRRSHRRRTVAIHVEPDRRVTVLIPAAASMQRVEDLLRKRLAWVRRRQRTFEALPPVPPPRQWIPGETHQYRGRQYRLKVRSGRPRSVRISGGYFLVTLPSTGDRSSIQRLMTAWYREHAAALFNERVRKAIASTTWLAVNPPRVSVRKLAQRWGSTTRAGHVTFNIELIKLPLPCIDYVVAHELVHLRIPDHSPAFWRMLGRIMPDWRKWQDRLSRQVA